MVEHKILLNRQLFTLFTEKHGTVKSTHKTNEMNWSKLNDNTQYLQIFEHVTPRGKCSLGRNVHARDATNSAIIYVV